MTMATFVIQITSVSMMAMVTAVTIDIMTIKITHFPMINCATIIVKATDIDWF